MDKIKEIIVVEGRDDTKKLALAVDCDTIETRGSAINRDILNQIELAHQTRGVIVFTDPDGPGEAIRKIISEAVPGVKHAFLTKDEARRKSETKESIGIEHASVDAIRRALSQVVEEKVQAEPTVSKQFLIKHDLIGSPQSRALRGALGEELRIGYTNGKQLEKRLNMFGITENEVSEALSKMKEERDDDKL
ncbi:MAG: ribonuclease M5 [Alkalibacterium sp.]|nr:ribonuclease M5 [Alkalibacterium sp.]TVP90999.1 MAG: ribonuclease M5 [Alkalibacterium sp.]